MAEQAADQDHPGLRTSLAGALRFVWLIGLPAGVALILLREPLVQVLFERGAFDRTATAAVSQVLVWYTWAVLADALCQPLWRVLYARRTAWLVLAVNGLQTTIRVVCNVAFIGELGYNGLALSAAIGLSTQVLVLGLLVRRDLGRFLTGAWWRGALRVLLVTTLAALVLSLTSSQLAGESALVRLLVPGILSGVIYVVLLWIMERLFR
jgi:putative peptidoglycan lipid II flippase